MLFYTVRLEQVGGGVRGGRYDEARMRPAVRWRAAGADPVPGLTCANDHAKWRARVELGWPGVRAVFDKALKVVEM